MRRQERLLFGWCTLVLFAVVLLAILNAPTLVVVSLMAFLPRYHQFSTPALNLEHRLRRGRNKAAVSLEPPCCSLAPCRFLPPTQRCRS